MTARRAIALALLLAAAVAAPEIAQACPMCMAGQGGGSSKAFAIGSLFLSVTPLVAIGGLVFYLRRRARALAAESAPPAAHPEPAQSRSTG